MKDNTLIECINVSIAYGIEEVLSDVNLKVPRGVVLPLIGPNGAGKTTLLRAFLGLMPLKRGTLRCHFAQLPPGYLPQHKKIDPLFPVSLRQIVTMGLYRELGFWRRPDPAERARIDEALERFDLTEHQAKTFGELSGGMRQKALLARAFISGADVLMLDEPTAGLDAASERYVLRHLLELNRNDGKTIILAHHRLEDVSHLAETALMVDRKTAKYLPAEKAWQHSETHFWEDL